MKKVLVLFFLVIIPVFAQDSSNVDANSASIGWFLAPAAKFTAINNKQASLVGGRAGIVFNHYLNFGIAGYALLTKIKSDEVIDEDTYNINFGYGGVEVEYVYKWNEPVHYTGSLFVGGGSLSYRDDVSSDDVSYSDDQVFIVEPAANIEFKLGKYIRFDAGCSYRFVSRVFFGDLSSKELGGFTASIALKFGSF